jgi:hypothetical protein
MDGRQNSSLPSISTDEDSRARSESFLSNDQNQLHDSFEQFLNSSDIHNQLSEWGTNTGVDNTSLFMTNPSSHPHPVHTYPSQYQHSNQQHHGEQQHQQHYQHDQHQSEQHQDAILDEQSILDLLSHAEMMSDLAVNNSHGRHASSSGHTASSMHSLEMNQIPTTVPPSSASPFTDLNQFRSDSMQPNLFFSPVLSAIPTHQHSRSHSHSRQPQEFSVIDTPFFQPIHHPAIAQSTASTPSFLPQLPSSMSFGHHQSELSLLQMSPAQVAMAVASPAINMGYRIPVDDRTNSMSDMLSPYMSVREVQEQEEVSVAVGCSLTLNGGSSSY